MFKRDGLRGNLNITTICGAQLRELLLPIAQHMRLYTTQVTHFTNSEIALGGNGRERFLH
jgi:hypothetical protein